MRAAVTRARGLMEVVETPEPREPALGEVLVRPEAVGLCGSDFHYFLGDLGTIGDPATLYPRIQGHELSAIVERVGPDELRVKRGDRVAVWPVASCGHCYPCRIGRGNACANISLVGIHRDGGLQDRLLLPGSQVFPVGDVSSSLAALIEPVSIAVRAITRGRVAPGDRVVVFGAGPIGQAVALAALDKGASVLLVDRVESRLRHGRGIGADLLAAEGVHDAVGDARGWAGGEGPEVVVEATGAPELLRDAVDLVAPAGRVVVVGLSDHDAPFRVGRLPFKEIDVLGVSCCTGDDFAAAVELVSRRRDVAAPLVTHEFALEQAPEAIAYAMANPVEVMKAVVRIDMVS
jgi:threonine dehydrogenase-like Zn-dependent dehydrogenase